MSDFDINKGNWIKDYDEYMLIKFTRKYEYQQDFLDGRLYFNTVDFFRKCDAKGQGDSNEGNNFIINNQDPKMISANLEKVNGQYIPLKKRKNFLIIRMNSGLHLKMKMKNHIYLILNVH